MKASESLQNDQSSATENEFRRVWFSLERRSLKRTWIAHDSSRTTPQALAEKFQISPAHTSARTESD